MTMDTSILSEVEHPPSHFSLPNQKKRSHPVIPRPEKKLRKGELLKVDKSELHLGGAGEIPGWAVKYEGFQLVMGVPQGTPRAGWFISWKFLF